MLLFNLGLLSHTCLEPCAILHFFSVCVMLECVVPQLAHVLGIRIYSKIRLSYIAFPLEASALTWHVARNMALLQGRHGFATWRSLLRSHATLPPSAAMRPHLCSDPHVLSQARRQAVRSHRSCKLPRSYATAPLHHCNTALLSTPRGRAFCFPFLACYWLTLQHTAHTNACKRAHTTNQPTNQPTNHPPTQPTNQHTYIHTYRQTQTDTGRHRQTQTDTDRHRQTQTDTDRHYNTIQYNTKQYNTIQYNTITYHTIPYRTVPYHTIPYIPLHYITLHCIALHYITLHDIHTYIIYITLHYLTWHDMTLHNMTWHYMTLHCVT